MTENVTWFIHYRQTSVTVYRFQSSLHEIILWTYISRLLLEPRQGNIVVAKVMDERKFFKDSGDDFKIVKAHLKPNLFAQTEKKAT